ncbi:MAG: hypothetical protein K2N64_03690 [Anaeroplasmataceae bacterium]|nr:hypothetical protein [Anaeroplasmataceae bacterium]
MNKKKIVIVLFLLFCLSFIQKIQADASNKQIIIFDDTDVNPHSAIVLNRGYYILGQRGFDVSENNFTGDYQYFYLNDGYSTISRQDFEFNLGLDLDDETIDMNLIEPFSDSFGGYCIKTYGVILLRVDSYASFFTSTSIEEVFFYGSVTIAVNTNTTIAGNMTHIVNIDSPIPLSQIKKRYTATDNVDGNLTNQIQFESNYNEASLCIGTYYISASVIDTANHKTYVIDIIQVKDFTPPEISLSKREHIIEVHTPFTSDEAKAFFTVTDNYTPSNQIKINFIDQYKSNYSALGTYTLTAKAYDFENNSSQETLTIQVVDTTKPTISLTAGGNTIISDHILTDNEIISLMMVEDNYYTISNENISIIENTCTGEQGKNFSIRVSVEDGSKNIGEATFTYYLTDTISPIIMVEKTLYIPIGSSYTNEQIISMLKEAGIILEDSIDVFLCSDPISTDKEGTFEISYIETSLDGTQQEKTVTLTIFSPEDSTLVSNSDSINPWYYLLFLLPIGIAIIYVFIKRKSYEKK